MTQPSDSPSPPEDLPAEIASTLETLDIHDLRETIVYAQELLQARHESTLQIEPRPGEEIVRMVDHGSYTEVAKRQPCGNDCPDCPHGPYVYHVRPEKHSDGTTRLHWTCIGRQVSDSLQNGSENRDK